MVDEAHIEKLAQLSRISLSEKEKESLKDDIGSILSYIEQIQEVSGDVVLEVGETHNVMREDGEPHESGVHSEALLQEAPHTERGFVKVRKIIDQS